MKRLLTVLTLVGLMSGTVVVAEALPSSASWVSANCSNSNSEVSFLRRSDARAYADIAVNEGYEWGGGCWNNNNRDDTPGMPDSNGEGPDCSGLTFKTWDLELTFGASGFHFWAAKQNIHGPYGSAAFHSPSSSDPFFTIAKGRTTTLYMDGFAYHSGGGGNVSMLYTSVNPTAGTDWIIEALGDYYGVGVNQENYRYDSRYTGVRRENWSPDCFPNCTYASSLNTVVMP